MELLHTRTDSFSNCGVRRVTGFGRWVIADPGWTGASSSARATRVSLLGRNMGVSLSMVRLPERLLLPVELEARRDLGGQSGRPPRRRERHRLPGDGRRAFEITGRRVSRREG